MTNAARALTAIVTCLLTVAAAAGAHAADTYWHGKRGPNWHNAVSGSLSNWYTAPPFTTPNTPVAPPTYAAVFAPTAQLHSVVLEEERKTQVTELRFSAGAFSPGAGAYQITVMAEARLTLTGRGILNESGLAPHFVLVDTGSLTFRNSTRIESGAGLSTAITGRGAHLLFLDKSNGGDATVLNTNSGQLSGLLGFYDRATAGSMIITNSGKAQVGFLDFSTAGNATLTNNYDFANPTAAVIDFSRTRGPANDRRITAGSIANNFGRVSVGETQITVLRDFTQLDNGTLDMLAIGPRTGTLRVKGKARLAGRLLVRTSSPQVGRYILINATGGRTGTFSSVTFPGLPATLKGRITVSSTQVVLFIERR